MTGMVQTVLGPLDPRGLGFTTLHEHLLIDLTPLLYVGDDATGKYNRNISLNIETYGWSNYDAFRTKDNLELLEETVAVSESLIYKMVGGKTIVDATSKGIGRDPMALRRIASVSGLNVIMGSGYYVDASHPVDINYRSELDLAQEIVDDITVGIGEAAVKAGIIGEIGCSWPLTERERKVLRAAALAQQETGAALLVHPGRDPQSPFDILDFLDDEGVNLERIVMCHLDRTFRSLADVLKLAASGCYLEYDGFGWETSNYPLSAMDTPNDAQRIVFVKELIDKGYGSRVVIAHDICTKHRTSYYGGHGFGHILKNIVPRMYGAGISERDVDAILVQNPAKVLAFG
jgi:phosphotriesterase-related protein